MLSMTTEPLGTSSRMVSGGAHTVTQSESPSGRNAVISPVPSTWSALRDDGASECALEVDAVAEGALSQGRPAERLWATPKVSVDVSGTLG